MVGRNVNESIPGHDIPFVGRLSDALDGTVRPDGLLLGIAPTGGKLPPAWRAIILEAIGAGLDIHSGLHQFLGRRSRVRHSRREFRFQAHRLPATPGPDGDDPRPPPSARQAGHPDGRHRQRDRQDVGRARARGRRPARRRLGGDGPDGPDRDDDRGLGRRGRPADQRLHQRHCRVARRARARLGATGCSSRGRVRSTIPRTAR